MTALAWDRPTEKVYETGLDRGVLYMPNASGDYTNGVAWNGLTSFTESPSGAETTKLYADNGVYAALVSAEEFGGTLEAYTYPNEFLAYDGKATPTPGVSIGQQNRRSFGLSYRTLVGNDTEGTEHGYKIHMVYGCQAAPSDQQFQTVNDSPEALTFSWEVTTVPVPAGPGFKPTALVTVDSRQVDSDALAALEDLLYGTTTSNPQLPSPATVISMFNNTVMTVTPTKPTYTLGVLTIPDITGVRYTMNGEEAAPGPYTITEDTFVEALPEDGYVFTPGVDTDWAFEV